MTDDNHMSLSEFVENKWAKLIARGAMIIGLPILGWVGAMVSGVDGRINNLETGQSEVRRDVNAIDARTVERAAVNDEFQDTITTKIDTLDNKVDGLTSRISEMAGILGQMQRQSVARNMTLGE